VDFFKDNLDGNAIKEIEANTTEIHNIAIIPADFNKTTD